MITNLKLFKKINILLSIILVLFLTSSCGSKQEKPMVTDDKDKIPEGLTSMADKGDTIIEDVEKIMEEMKKPEKKRTATREAAARRSGWTGRRAIL